MAERPSARLAVIGDGTGPEAARFKAQIRASSDGSVALIGSLTGPEKYAWMSRARTFIFPSHYESWGLVVLEAMASGVPVVGYDLPSSREAFGDAMLTVPLGDRAALAAAVIRLLESDSLRLEFARRGRQLAARYEWNQITDKLVASL